MLVPMFTFSISAALSSGLGGAAVSPPIPEKPVRVPSPPSSVFRVPSLPSSVFRPSSRRLHDAWRRICSPVFCELALRGVILHAGGAKQADHAPRPRSSVRRGYE
ncbi:hypothetical protein NUW54_g11275 [Trametes sanguinea]|uniref:Uncharacterized protein n=1 Tax=Trametes sanguinea TaxID=158606 RepID=A0ACC1NHU0_9APHY|nr:hypothetical protein NUW54_g11275 [Trametes sanguinea]